MTLSEGVKDEKGNIKKVWSIQETAGKEEKEAKGNIKYKIRE